LWQKFRWPSTTLIRCVAPPLVLPDLRFSQQRKPNLWAKEPRLLDVAPTAVIVGRLDRFDKLKTFGEGPEPTCTVAAIMNQHEVRHAVSIRAGDAELTVRDLLDHTGQ